MEKLVQTIKDIQGKLDGLRRHSLKETPTRTIVIDRVLEALDWDVRDPDEVQMEYPTVDGRSVDYALKLNRKPVLLVEAKALDDPLDNVKDITQVVGYAANDGIAWCVLTSGAKWKVYHSVQKCQAPDKLMFEVSLDPRDSAGLSIDQLATHLWRFSREEMAKGTLDTLGDHVFTDGKVRKALSALMCDPPRALLNIIRAAIGDEGIAPQKIKESLMRVWPTTAAGSAIHSEFRPGSEVDLQSPRSPQGTPASKDYGEQHHVVGKPQEVLQLYSAIDKFCLSLNPERVQKRCLAKYISYGVGRHPFCCMHLRQGGLRVWLRVKYGRLQSPPTFARDVSNIGHWGMGDLELAISALSQVQEAQSLIRRSFEETVQSRARG